MSHLSLCSPLLLAALLLATHPGVAPAEDGPELFEQRIRPVLVAHCYECHSAGTGKSEGGLQLDNSAAIRRGGDGGAILVAGRPQASRLLGALRYEDLEMPPTGRLPDRVVEDFHRWIELGAPLPEPPSAVPASSPPAHEGTAHWAFQPLRRPPLPAVKDDDGWCRSALDRFVLARLQQQGLSPSPAADRRTLIRRLYFDLLGLPPTADEIEGFEQDRSPQAVERLVDRLLASPQYGERWGRHWLDVARYADTKDLVLLFGPDRIRPYAYTYRDYVIGAWNRDLPFDRFVHEQLAADLLTPVDRASLAALGLLNIGRMFDENLPDVHDDRIDVVTRGFMALTVTCARCHDHKYDPIPTADYYSLYGVFASCEIPLELPLIADLKADPEVEGFERQAGEIRQRLAKHIDTQYAQLLDEARQRVTDYLLKIASTDPDFIETSVFFMSLSPEDLRPQIVLRWRQYIAAHSGPDDPLFGPWGDLLSPAPGDDDFAARAERVLSHWAKVPAGTDSGQLNPIVWAELSAAPLASSEDVARAYGRAFRQSLQQWRDAGPSLDPLDAAHRQLAELLVTPEGPVFFLRQHAYLYMARVERSAYHSMIGELDKLAVTSPAAPPRAMSLVDAPEPYEPRIFLRGNPNVPGRAVPRQFLAALDPDRRPFQQGSGRLELADAITSPNNPLTSRVIVNRVWMHHFGEPLVATPSDFGLRSSPPTHPELLDYLAWTLQHEDAWSLKQLHRRILLSSTYQQASSDRSDCRQRDPENRLLWRARRQRLDFEAMRDAMLRVSNRLDPCLGGRPVDVAGDARNRRRTVYGLVDRQELPAAYRAFDFASPDQSAAQRPRTTTPQQALFGLNSPFVVEQARALAAIAPRQRESGCAPVEWLYRQVLAREPTEVERQWADQFLDGSPAEGQPPAADRWIELAQLLLLTNEFMFVD